MLSLRLRIGRGRREEKKRRNEGVRGDSWLKIRI
jgi:hypothetical protein